METTLGLIGGEDEGGGAGELELGLGLSLTCSKGSTVAWGGDQYGRILTAKDFPNGFPTTITKRHAEVGSTVSGNAVSSQVVGWPPIGAHRMSSFVNQNQGKNSNVDENKKVDNEATEERLGHVIGFVKVNVDGLKIGRKVDLNAHSSYQSLAKSLEQMFFNSSSTSGEENNSSKQASKLLDGSSEFELTYEDKEGDWMLVGDVPWGMFLSTVKRLRVMRTSEATNGLAPRFQEGKDRQKGKRI